jgi:hypothetical protein
MMLSNNSTVSNPRVAVYDNKVYVVWTDNNSKGNSDIIFRKSTDKGGTFDMAKNLSNNPGNSTNPLITAYHNNVYVVWTDNTTGNTDINFRKSSDYGNNFNRTTNLSRNNGSSISPQLAATGNNVYVVWTNDTTGNTDINFRKSSDYGNKFAGEKNLSENLTGSSFSPKIAALDREKIHITWTAGTNNESDIFFTASGDAGEHFDNALDLSRSTSLSDSVYMATYQKDLYLVWVESDSSGRGGEIFFKRLSETYFPRNSK